jgi:hypothetical protein
MDIESFCLGESIRLILRHGRLRQRGVRILRGAIREFFLPQFQSRLFPRTRPVAVIAHPADDCLPFVPGLFRRYLAYFSLWLRTLSSLYRMYGEIVLGDIEEMMLDISRLYEVSGQVYRRCQSTTTSRRSAPGNPYFLLIAVFDPHLHCIPSLHILTICYNYHRTRQITARVDPGGASGRRLTAGTYAAALRITEAILLVKQHSLLDVGPSLFLLSRVFPDFDAAEIRSFVSDLFTDTSVVDQSTASRIRAVIMSSFRELQALQRRLRDSPATDVLLVYIKEIARRSGGSAKKAFSTLPRRQGES